VAKAVKRTFPKLLGKSVCNAWASEGVAGGDAVQRANAREAMAASAPRDLACVERQFVFDFRIASVTRFSTRRRLDGSRWRSWRRSYPGKANVDVGTDVLHVLSCRESQTRVSFVAGQKGLCSSSLKVVEV